MTQVAYPYKRLQSRRYLFISDGKKRIAKVVDFIPLGIGNIVNIGFGDLLPDGSMDDKVNSNNGDIIKVLATVVDILRHFTTQNPRVIAGVIGIKNEVNVIPYNPKADQEYLGFLIKKYLNFGVCR